MLKEHGSQAWFSRKSGIRKEAVHAIFTGKRRATTEQAMKLEPWFAEKGVPINRWDLLYGDILGKHLGDYAEEKLKPAKTNFVGD